MLPRPERTQAGAERQCKGSARAPAALAFPAPSAISFPAEDSKSYDNIQRNYVVYLVEQVDFEKEAKKPGVAVSQKEGDDDLAAYVDSNNPEDRKTFEQHSKAQGFTLATSRKTLRASILTRKVLAAANRNVKVDDRDLVAYCKVHRTTKYAHTPSKQVKDSIYATGLSQERGEANVAWLEDLPSRYKDKVEYAKGFEPPGS